MNWTDRALQGLVTRHSEARLDAYDGYLDGSDSKVSFGQSVANRCRRGIEYLVRRVERRAVSVAVRMTLGQDAA